MKQIHKCASWCEDGWRHPWTFGDRKIRKKVRPSLPLHFCTSHFAFWSCTAGKNCDKTSAFWKQIFHNLCKKTYLFVCVTAFPSRKRVQCRLGKRTSCHPSPRWRSIIFTTARGRLGILTLTGVRADHPGRSKTRNQRIKKKTWDVISIPLPNKLCLCPEMHALSDWEKKTVSWE